MSISYEKIRRDEKKFRSRIDAEARARNILAAISFRNDKWTRRTRNRTIWTPVNCPQPLLSMVGFNLRAFCGELSASHPALTQDIVHCDRLLHSLININSKNLYRGCYTSVKISRAQRYVGSVEENFSQNFLPLLGN